MYHPPTTVGAHSGRPNSFDEAGRVFGRGVLFVEIYEAQGIKGDEMKGIGRADPYLKVKHGNLSNRVTLESKPHQDAGSNPVWNCRFQFPLRNGGTRDHNILEIEIWNKNKNIFRRDNHLGHLRIGGLASWIARHPHGITDSAWYPVFRKRHRRSKDLTEGEKQGEILMQFYFEPKEEQVFAHGHHTEPGCSELQLPSNRGSYTGSYTHVQYRRLEGNALSAFFGGVSAAVGIAQTLIVLL